MRTPGIADRDSELEVVTTGFRGSELVASRQLRGGRGLERVKCSLQILSTPTRTVTTDTYLHCASMASMHQEGERYCSLPLPMSPSVVGLCFRRCPMEIVVIIAEWSRRTG
jgi:hypothetical protein